MDCRGFLRNLAMTEAWQSRPGTGRGHCEPRQRRSNPDRNGPRSLRASTGAKQSRQERAAVIASLDRGEAIQNRKGRGHCEPRQRRGNPDQERPRSLRASTGAWQSRTGRAAVIASLGRGVAIQNRNGPQSLRASTEEKQSGQERAAVIASLDRGVAIQTGTGRSHCEPRQRRGNPLLSQRVGAGAPLRAETETLAF